MPAWPHRWKLGLFVIAIPLAVAGVWFGASLRGGGDTAPPFDPGAQPPEVLAAYQFAETHPDVFARVPCYCGCGKSLGHGSLLDCFLRPGGKGYESHASGCVICLGEARDVERLLALGNDTAAVRSWIDEEYRKYGPPTNTP